MFKEKDLVKYVGDDNLHHNKRDTFVVDEVKGDRIYIRQCKKDGSKYRGMSQRYLHSTSVAAKYYEKVGELKIL